jgi:hypothetical protein
LPTVQAAQPMMAFRLLTMLLTPTI